MKVHLIQRRQKAEQIPGSYQRIEKIVNHKGDRDTSHSKKLWNSLHEWSVKKAMWAVFSDIKRLIDIDILEEGATLSVLPLSNY